ncbi:glycosyltransferase family 4 protein [candidate division CSSED10-310 bacterium]|uniref:Glycosyltransferase family 4 protein n=1 Tax=candidate division CSSED10-310 bacterium TaxID=2855610 RepID=A0ABV6YUE1_UNCC1
MQTLFATFDIFPTAKGASTHIAQTVRALQKFKGPATLVCLGSGDMPHHQSEEGITIRRCLTIHPNFLSRTELFDEFLTHILNQTNKNLKYIHFRDIWSGLPILEHPRSHQSRLIFEVNGLPSIELPLHYPHLQRNPGFLGRLRAMEQYCLQRVDHIITVSRVNANHLLNCGADPKKMTVIPNTFDGVGTDCHHSEETPSPEFDTDFILYAGTLSPWQGIPILLQAFSYLVERNELILVLACSSRKYLRPIRKLIKKLDLEGRVKILIEVSRERLSRLYSQALFTVAPLTRCDRNQVQGCSPLKIIESMAVGTPVLASNLAVCREIITHQQDGWLFTPDSTRSLALSMTTLLDDPDLLPELGLRAQQKVRHQFDKSRWSQELQKVYQTL